MYNVQKFTGRDGRVRLYFRKAGMERVPLHSPLPAVWEGSALKVEVDALLGLKPPKAVPGTLRGAIRAYELESADFKALAESTKALYRGSMYELDSDFGHLPVSTFKPAYLLKLRNLWAARGHRACNIRLQVLKNVLWPAIVAGMIGEGDPFALIPNAPRPHDLAEPHVIWPEAVVETVILAAAAEKKFGLARAVALGRYTGARRGDLIKIAKSARANGRISFLSGKRRVPVDAPEDLALTFWLNAIPNSQPDIPRRGRKGGDAKIARMPARDIVFNLRNARYTEDGLGQELAKLVAVLHKDGKIDQAGYDLHGLRHTRGVELALAGCTDAQGAAAMGHSSAASFAQYRRQADRIRLGNDAALLITRLRERTTNEALSNDVSNTCQTQVGGTAAGREKP